MIDFIRNVSRDSKVEVDGLVSQNIRLGYYCFRKARGSV